jgi:hypothetical protein
MSQPGSEVDASGIDFDFTPEDALAFGVLAGRAAGASPRTRNAALALIFAAVATVVLFAYDFGWKGWTIVALVLFATLMLRPSQLFRRLPRRFRGHVRLELRDTGIRTVRDGLEGWYGWEAVEALVAMPQYLGVYLRPRRALPVPRRAFATAEQEASFRADLERRSGRTFADAVSG